MNPGEKKTITREERKQKKIAAMEKKRQRRDERKYSKTGDRRMEHGLKKDRDHTSATSFTLFREEAFPS